MPESEARRLLRRCLRRNVSGAPANGLVIPVHAAVRIMRRPARFFLEQPDRTNAAVPAKIEPVQRPARNANQVAGLHLDRNNRALLRMNMEQASASDDVTDFVLIMGMLDVELCEHRIQPGSIGMDVDHIRRDVTSPALEFLDLSTVGAQDLVRGGIAGQLARGLPAFVLDADSGEVVADLTMFAERTMFIGNLENGHKHQLRVRTVRESRGLRGARTHQHFHQELQNFNMPLGFLQAHTPSIKPMVSQKKSMDAWACLKDSRDTVTQLDHVLRILKNRQPLAVLVRSDAFQSFEHFVSFERDASLRRMRARKHRAPNRMSVQDRAGAHAVHDGQMKQCLRRRPATAADDAGCTVYLQKLRQRERTLVQSRRSHRQPQGLARNHRAKVSTRSQNPSPRVEIFSNLRQFSSSL